MIIKLPHNVCMYVCMYIHTQTVYMYIHTYVRLVVCGACSCPLNYCPHSQPHGQTHAKILMKACRIVVSFESVCELVSTNSSQHEPP